jgi:hypothetical protein
MLGRDRDAFYAEELGLAPDEIARLRERQVI